MNSFNKHKIEWTSEKIGRFWDFTSKTNVPYFSKQVGANVISMVGRQLSIRGPVLDYGSGPGYLLNNLLDMGLDCHGLDISKTAVDLINTRFKKLPNF
nr:class I SAM-dependent methyltransferase [Candidatus Sigynarchaeum springense]